MSYLHHFEWLTAMRKLAASMSILSALLLVCEPAWCADAGPIAISVPEGFGQPTRSDENGGLTIGWIKRQPASDGGTLLQVSAIDIGDSLDKITPDQRMEATTHYLLEFVKGIGQHVGDFEFGDIDHTTLAGLPAAWVRWNGTVNGKATVGVIYCVVVRQSVVSLQTQDLGSGITPSMYAAIGAIERIRAR